MTSSTEILKVLEAIYSRRSYHNGNPLVWAFFPEFRIGTGYGKSAEQRIDAWAMCMYPSEMLKRLAFEIKISRSDFLSEIKNPIKRRAALLCSNEFYFVMPKGLIKLSELPLECGLMEYEKGNISITVSAPWRESIRPNWKMFAALCRRIKQIEEDTKK